MAIPNFFNENMGRTFPFLQDFQDLQTAPEVSLSISLGAVVYDMQLLPNDTIVDFGTNLGIRISYEPDTHTVYLFEVRRQQSNFIFEFRCTAPDLSERVLLFSRAITDTDYETEYVEALLPSQEFSLSLSECGGDTDWEGYLSTGTMETLATVLTNDGDKLRGAADVAVIEHGLVRSLQGTFLRSVNIANADRTRAENPTDCTPLVWPFTVQPIYIAHECISRHLRLVEGYNTSIQQSQINNAITVSAVVGAGAGEPCLEVPLFPSEAAPAGNTVLTGGSTCNEVIRSINGIGGRVLAVQAGAGVNVTSEPSNNRVIVDFDMTNLALCFAEDPFDDASCSVSSSPVV